MDKKLKNNLINNIISSLCLLAAGTGLIIYSWESGAGNLLMLSALGGMGLVFTLLWRKSGYNFIGSEQVTGNTNGNAEKPMEKLSSQFGSFIHSFQESNQNFYSRLEALIKQSKEDSQSILGTGSLQIEKMNNVLAELFQAAMDKQLDVITSIAETNEGSRPESSGTLNSVAEKLGDVTIRLASSSKLLEDASSTYQVNQASLQAGIEMLNDGLAQILEKLDEQKDKSQDQKEFIENLYRTLEAFHEKASEVLLENSLKTREMLLNGMSGKQETFNS